MKKSYILTGLIFVVILISGCIQEFEPITTTTIHETTIIPTTTVPSIEKGNFEVVYSLSGGYGVGLSDTIRVHNNGSIVWVTASRFKNKTTKSGLLSEGKLRDFKNLILKANIFSFKDEYRCFSWCPTDLPYSSLKITIDNKTKTISIYPPGDAPEKLKEIIQKIQKFKTITTTVSPIEKGNFEVHEWGVLAGCSTNDSYFLTSRPEQVMMVRQPVIYIHSEDKKPFTVQVTFNNGKPTDTYPEAEVDGNIVIWRNVKFSEDCRIIKARGVRAYVPLESIVETLNDVDADCLDYNDQRARFLFYEGELKFENKIEATYSFEKQEATLKNNGNYPAYNLILVASKDGSHIFSPDVYISRVEKLDSGQKLTVKFTEQKDVALETDLVSQGFTEKESEAFSKLWERSFIYPSNRAGWANLIYRLSREEYDDMITLNFNPQPERIIRSLYILVHLNE